MPLPAEKAPTSSPPAPPPPECSPTPTRSGKSVVLHQKEDESSPEISPITNADELWPHPKIRKEADECMEDNNKSIQLPILEQDDDSSKETKGKRLSLADILSANPAEDEAETLIMEVIEQQRAVKSSSEHIFAAEMLFAVQNVDDDNTESRRVVPRRGLRKESSTWNLMSLVDDYDDVHSEADELVGDGHAPAQEDEEGKGEERVSLLGPKEGRQDRMFRDCLMLFQSNGQKDADPEKGEFRSASGGKSARTRHRVSKRVRKGIEGAAHLSKYLAAYKRHVRNYLLSMLTLIVLVLATAAIIFYGFDNSPQLGNTGASVSFLLVFIARHLLMWSVACVSELFVIGYTSRCEPRY